jgi:DNA-binding NarL/FixJ family response regulator
MLFVRENETQLKALCVARHQFIAEHFARFFGDLGIETRAAVGIQGAPLESWGLEPDVVICEYEMLATLSIEAIERDALLAKRPLIAVSLSRRPTEQHVLDLSGIGGFLYLPLLEPDAALRVISAAAASARQRYVPALATTSPLPAIKT